MMWTGLLALSTTVHAAEVTDMAPGTGGLVGVSYVGTSLSGNLKEQDQTVADRRVQRHDLNVQLEVAPIEGVAITLELATTPSLRLTYPNAREMVAEPASGSGSYLPGGVVEETPAVQASGLQGVWIGGAVAPVAERYAGTAGSTWRLDLAVRPGSKGNNLWTTGDSGKRGVAPGGTGLRVIGGFSSDRGMGNPYMQAKYQREGATTVDVTDESGASWGELELKPASTFDLRGGVEIVAYDAPANAEVPGARFALDLFIGVGYRSWEDVASGVYLPNVLENGRKIPVTVGDHITARTGFGLDYHVNEVVRGRTGMDLSYGTPHRVEHIYDVRTSADTYRIGWFFTVQAASSFKKAAK